MSPHPNSFGFIPDAGLKLALQCVVGLREEYTNVFETDIVGFFDQISRPLLIQKLDKALGNHSLVHIITRAIRCEIKPKTTDQANRIKALGIVEGKGLRQGMPLSPLLSNLALSAFDKKINSLGIRMGRYADDIVVFARNKSEAVDFGKIVEAELLEIGHEIPKLEINTKTKIAGRYEALNFLGREISFSEKLGRYVQNISETQIAKITKKISTENKIDKLISDGISFPEFSRNIISSMNAYLSAYWIAPRFDRTVGIADKA